jgi:hypothetical protein
VRKHVGWLLLIPISACLIPWVYNRRTPALAGIPFFYWFQLALVPLGALFAGLVVALERSGRTRDRAAGRK